MKVNGKDYPYIMENKIHVPNHQPDCYQQTMVAFHSYVNVYQSVFLWWMFQRYNSDILLEIFPFP